MDFKHFQKVHEAKDHSILRHPDGHEIKILHAKLKKNEIGKLKALPVMAADGVDTENVQGLPEKVTPLNATDVPEMNFAEVQGAIPNTTPDAVPQYENKQYVSPNTSGIVSSPQDPFAMQSAEKANQTALQGAVSGIKQEADVAGKLGTAQAAILGGKENQLQQIMDNYKLKHDVIEKDINQAMSHYEKAEINPNHFWESKSTGQKVVTAVGMLLGAALGADAAGFLQKAQDKDIAAQVDNMNKQRNLVGFNFQKYGDLQTATEMTKLMQDNYIMTEMQRQAAASTNPMVKARAQQMMLPLQQQIIEGKQKVAAAQALLSPGMDAGNLLQYYRTQNPKAAEELEKRYVPGMGVAQIPVPDKVREELSIRHELDGKLGRLEEFSAKHSGSLDPAVINEGKALAQDAQDVYRRANGQGVFREAESHFVQGMIDTDPTKFFSSFRTIPAYEAVKRGNRAALNEKASSLGLGYRQAESKRPIRNVLGR